MKRMIVQLLRSDKKGRGCPFSPSPNHCLEGVVIAELPSWTVQSKTTKVGFPGGAVVENLPANAGDMGSSPSLGRSHMLRSN